MKSLFFSLFLGALLLGQTAYAQDVTFALANANVTNSGTQYEFDILISSNAGFKLGSGQLYFNFNEATFGANVTANGKVVFETPPNSLLGTQVGNPPFQFPYYSSFITNDNKTDRVSFAWQHAFSEACLTGNNVTHTPQLLAHAVFTFQAGGNALDPGICFESTDLFTNQTFTACGPATCTNADCQATPGLQLTNDTYDCSAVLPVELTRFTAIRKGEDVQLDWQTSMEVGTSHFTVEKSVDGLSWVSLERVTAVGDSQQEQHYQLEDEQFAAGYPAAHTFYYRLQIVDWDGSFEYSDIEQIKVQQTEGTVQIFPNPVPIDQSCRIVLQGNRTQDDLQCTILDSHGRTVLQRDLTAAANLASTIHWSVEDLPTGVYFVRIGRSGEVTAAVQRVVVQ